MAFGTQYVDKTKMPTTNNNEADENKGNDLPKLCLTPFQVKKFENLFHTLYDTHKDMTVSRQDFFELLKKTARIRQWKAGSDNYKKATERLAGFWSALMTGNKRYRNNALQTHVKLSEWLQYWSDFVEAANEARRIPAQSLHRIAPVSYAWHASFVKFLFELMDISGDGIIDKTEYTNCFQEFGLSAGDCVRAFTEMAPNGHIAEEDFEGLWYQYLTSNNDSDPGNCLLGRIYIPESV